jgi:hypothetical protein
MIEKTNWPIVRSTPPSLEPDPADSALQIFRLSKGSVRELQHSRHVIRVVAGCAWITLKGEDIIVENGHEIHLDPGEDTGVISNLCDDLLVYEVR